MVFFGRALVPTDDVQLPSEILKLSNGADPWTFTSPAARAKARGWLIRQYPQLGALVLPAEADAWPRWLTALEKKFGPEITVYPFEESPARDQGGTVSADSTTFPEGPWPRD